MAKTKTKTVSKEVQSTPKETTKKSSVYKLEIKVNDVVFNTQANTIKEALLDFISSPDYPFGAKTRMFIKCKKGNVERHRVFHTSEARRIILTMKHKDISVDILADKLTKDLE